MSDDKDAPSWCVRYVIQCHFLSIIYNEYIVPLTI